ncbi:MAG: hypothetical protein IK027_04550 [Deltaproteobacteria bacterium]|nr:hypothetical protein [Deltaproteobacteria bacterium]
MKQIRSFMLAFMLLCACAAATVCAAEGLKDVHCNEQGFSTKIPEGLSAYWEKGNGLRISVGSPGYVPFVLVWKTGRMNFDPAEYFKRDAAHMKEKYGDRLRAFSVMEYYEVGGKKLPAARYVYDTNSARLGMMRLIEPQQDYTVIYTAKYINGDDKATLAALDAAVRYLRPDGANAGPGIGPAPGPNAGPNAGGTRQFNRRQARPIISGTTNYSDGRFSMMLPTGWKIQTAGEYMTFACKAWDPARPNRSIFLMLKLEPFLKSQTAKKKYRQVAKTVGGTYAFFAEAPVMESPTLPAFLKTLPDIRKFCAKFHASKLTLNPGVVPDMARVEILETRPSTIPCPPTCRDNSIARIKYMDHQGQPGEALVTAQPVEGMKYNFFGVDGWFHTVYGFMGVTAPIGEMQELEPILTKCLSSFNFTQEYVKRAINVSNEERNALLARGRAMQQAHDDMVNAWRAREKAHDIAFQKWSDAFMGYDRLYDSRTGEVYRAELGFYDTYKLHREEYANSNLQIVDSSSQQYYLKGVDYYITK